MIYYTFIIYSTFLCSRNKSILLHQSKLGNEFKKCDKKSSTRYTNGIAYWIATDMQPNNVVSKEGFKHMTAVLCPGFTVPSK